MTNAISWAAVSSKPQADRESLHDQHRLNHALAEALGWEVAADITVSGESRSYHRLSEAVANLEAYRTLQEHATSGNIAWLIVKDRSRLARTRRLNRDVADYLQDRGVRVYSRTMPPANTSQRTESDVWGEAIESGYSEAEVLRLVQRREMGMQARVRRGAMPGRLPWGFAYVSDGSRTPDRRRGQAPDPRSESRAGRTRGQGPDVRFMDVDAERSIRFVVDSFLSGVTKTWIAQEATRQGLHTPRGGPWNRTVINGLLNQPSYFGLVGYGRRRLITRNGKRTKAIFPWEDCGLTEAAFEGLYTPDAWDRVRVEQKRRLDQHPRTRGAPFVLSQLVYCVEHSRYLIGNRKGWGAAYYVCRPKSVPGPWAIHSIRSHVLHQRVADYFLSLASSPSMLEDVLSQLDTPDDQGWDQMEERLLSEGDDVQRRLKRVWEAYEAGAISLSEYTDRAHALKARQDRIEAELATIEQSRLKVQDRDTLRDLLVNELPNDIVALTETDLTPQQRQRIHASLSRACRAIHVAGGEVTGVWFAGA